MGNDENWIRSLREAGRRFEMPPVPGLWEELEGELLVSVVRKSVRRRVMWYVAASMVIAVVASLYLFDGRHTLIDEPAVLTIVTDEYGVKGDEMPVVDESVEPLLALNGAYDDGVTRDVPTEMTGAAGDYPEEGLGYGEFSYYERIIVVEEGNPMSNECVMVTESTDIEIPDNLYTIREKRGKELGGRLYASVAGLKLSGTIPVSAGVTLDLPLADRLRLEAGLEYTGARVGGSMDSRLGVPVKVNYDVYDGDDIRVYASAGAAVEKSLNRRDVGMSLNAGVGLEYSVDEDWGVFVEPGVECRPVNGGCVPAYGDRRLGPEVRVGFRHTFR